MWEFTNFLSARLWMVLMVYHSLAQDPPKQQQCTDRQAIQISDDIMSQLQRNPKWFVVRATILTEFPFGAPPPSINTCAPLHYLQQCFNGAIHFDREYTNDKSLSQLTSAYNPQDQTIVNYFEDRKIDDENYFIFSGSLRSMKLYRNVSGQVEKISEIDSNFPYVVTATEERQYAMTNLGLSFPGNVITWVLYQDCTLNLAWIEINKWVVFENMVDIVNQEIDAFLQQNPNLNLPQMVAISVDLPFMTPDQQK